jgi:hypothetical protein
LDRTSLPSGNPFLFRRFDKVRTEVILPSILVVFLMSAELRGFAYRQSPLSVINTLSHLAADIDTNQWTRRESQIGSVFGVLFLMS